jgi:hypothetical protein
VEKCVQGEAWRNGALGDAGSHRRPVLGRNRSTNAGGVSTIPPTSVTPILARDCSAYEDPMLTPPKNDNIDPRGVQAKETPASARSSHAIPEARSRHPANVVPNNDKVPLSSRLKM